MSHKNMSHTITIILQFLVLVRPNSSPKQGNFSKICFTVGPSVLIHSLAPWEWSYLEETTLVWPLQEWNVTLAIDDKVVSAFLVAGGTEGTVISALSGRFFEVDAKTVHHKPLSTLSRRIVCFSTSLRHTVLGVGCARVQESIKK